MINWSITLIENALSSLPLVQAALPFMNLLFQWTQILTCAHSPTAGLLLMCIDRLKAALVHLGTIEVRAATTLRREISEVRKSFEHQIDEYFGTNAKEFWLYQVATFLDPRTFMLIRPAAWKDILVHLNQLATKEERCSELELAMESRQLATSSSASASRRAPKKGSVNAVIAISEEQHVSVALC